MLPAKQACCAAALKFQGTEKATLTVRRLAFYCGLGANVVGTSALLPVPPPFTSGAK